MFKCNNTEFMKNFNFYVFSFAKTDWLKLVCICCLLLIIDSVYARDYLCFTAEEAEATVKLDTVGTPAYKIGLKCSSNGKKWKDYIMGENIILRKVGDKVYFKAKEFENVRNSAEYWYNHYQFVIPKRVSASGNIMSLLDSTCQRMDVPKGAFCRLFEDCKGLLSSPKLSATTLAESCYSGMFAECKSLKKAPALPATTLAEGCYSSMFWGCKSLREAPKLPATTLAKRCYVSMFINCTKLNSISVAFSEWKPNYTSNWLHNVSPTGTFICPDSLPEVFGTYRIPLGWTVQHQPTTDKH